MIWRSIAKIILRNRLVFLIAWILLTAFMAYETTRVKLSYDFYKTVPEDNPAYIDYENFKGIFGDEGNVMFVALQAEDFWNLDFFKAWCNLEKELRTIPDVESALSVSSAVNLVKNTSQRRFDVHQIFLDFPETQNELDSLKEEFFGLPFYENRIYNADSNTYVLFLSLDKNVLDSPRRINLIEDIQEKTEAFAKQHAVDFKYSGLPFIRYYQLTTITSEVRLFLILAICITIFTLYFLFRSIDAVIFPLLIIGSGVVICTGMMALMDYKLTVLTSLIPSLLIIMGIPNCVYLLNKYHMEFRRHGNKVKALSMMIEKVGFATLVTNATKAVGFTVFCFTGVKILEEFGLITTIGVISTFIISLVGIPVVYSYLPKPKPKHTDHLEGKQLQYIIGKLDNYTQHHRKTIFTSAIIVVLISVFGVLQLKSKGYILDEVSEKTEVYQDMKFLERVFHGVMPFEIMISKNAVVQKVQDTIVNTTPIITEADTSYKYDTVVVVRIDTSSKKITNLTTLQKINQLQDTLATYPALSSSLSIIDGLKFARQAYYNGIERYYDLPDAAGMTSNDAKVKEYLENSEQKGVLQNRFVDKKGEVARITVQVADVGSDSMPKILENLQPKIDSIFDKKNYSVAVTGTSVVAVEGYQYLINSLAESLALALIVISLILLYQFRSGRLLMISLLPNLIPLFITGAIMGFLHISIKPSTVLIFSIAYGMCVDFTAYFMAKYKQDLVKNSFDIPKTVTASLKESGVSMIYTAVILFAGFFIFTFSKFGGTANMGLLTSITLVVAMFNNLLLLPALILLFEKGLRKSHIRRSKSMYTDLIEVKEEQKN